MRIVIDGTGYWSHLNKRPFCPPFMGDLPSFSSGNWRETFIDRHLHSCPVVFQDLPEPKRVSEK